ncbi:hypothetical protein ACFL6I_22535, partial [candidate division KSB1 bacterium]
MRLYVNRISIVCAAVCLFIGISLVVPSDAVSQQSRVLTLEESIRIALNQSHTIQTENLTYERQQLRLEQQKLSLRTRVDYSMTVPSFDQGIRRVETPEVTEFVNTTSLATSGGLEISQPLLWTNGRFFIQANYSTLNQEREAPGQGGVIQTFETKRWTDDITINFMQPLLQPNDLKLDLEAIERNFHLAERNFETTQAQVYFNVMNSFFDLYRTQRSLE